VAVWWFSPGPPVFSTNKTGCHEIIVESGIKHHKTNLTYMLGLKLINLVAFFKWEHVDVINFLLTLCKGFIVKQGTLDFFCASSE
jgi:hypothetical protein